jgi:hypothetical protein
MSGPNPEYAQAEVEHDQVAATLNSYVAQGYRLVDLWPLQKIKGSPIDVAQHVMLIIFVKGELVPGVLVKA